MKPTSLGIWERWAACLWGVAVLCACTFTVLSPHRNSTYPIFANAGRQWLAGEGLYGHSSKVHDVYRYSPLVAAAFAPLGLLPDGPAGALWRLVGAAALLWALLWWARTVLPPAMGSRRGPLLLLVLPLTVPSLHNGQSNLLMVALVLASVAAAARRHWNLCSVCVALACMLKLYPLAVGLLLAALYPRQLIGRLALALSACLALPFLLQEPSYVAGQYWCWAESLAREDRRSWTLCCWPRDAYLLCEVWLGHLPAEVYRGLQVLTGVGSAALCVWARARGWPEGRVLTLLTALGCCWMTAFGPATESSTFILLAPSLAAELLELRQARSWRVSAGLVIAYALLVLTYAAKWFPWGKIVGGLGLQPLAALIFLGCAGTLALGRLRRRSPDETVPDDLMASDVAPGWQEPGYARAGRWLPTTLALLLLLAAPAVAWSQQVETARPAPRAGTVFVVGGVGGFDSLPYTAQLAWPRAGVPHDVEDFVWTHGWGQMFRDLQDTPHVARKAEELAAVIQNARAKAPERPIYLVAKSGGAGLALMATRHLPPATLERLVLLSAAVSPGYDLRPALRATRSEVVSFFSPNDQVILNWGTSAFGTVDRQYSASAGLRGFTVPSQLTPADRDLYRRLVQIAWKPRMLWLGYAGMHSGTSSPFFLVAEVAPWLKD